MEAERPYSTLFHSPGRFFCPRSIDISALLSQPYKDWPELPAGTAFGMPQLLIAHVAVVDAPPSLFESLFRSIEATQSPVVAWLSFPGRAPPDSISPPCVASAVPSQIIRPATPSFRLIYKHIWPA